MATTNIADEIELIAQVTTADSKFIVSAQKAVSSSIPKEILRWATSETTVGSHGGNSSATKITLPSKTDNIISVKRGTFIAQETLKEDAPFIAPSSGSLKVATSTFPKYYRDSNNSIVVKPDPTDSATGIVEYVDFSKFDDDCDLKSAIVYKAASNELMAKASTSVVNSDISLQTEPVAPEAPSFTYTDVSIPDVDFSILSIDDMASLSASAPEYVEPVISSPDYSDANNWINSEEDSEMSSARVQVIQSQIADFNSKLQDSLNSFNKENIVYQEDIQRKIQNLNKDTQEAIQQLQSDLSIKNANLSKDQQVSLQNAVQNFQAEVQEYSSKLQLYSSELSSYQGKVSEEVQRKQNKLQQSQTYLAEADKYYNWYLLEIKQYIESNSNMINKSMAMQAMSSKR
jgi:hypothetical protein